MGSNGTFTNLFSVNACGSQGVVIDNAFRRRAEKVVKQISQAREACKVIVCVLQEMPSANISTSNLQCLKSVENDHESSRDRLIKANSSTYCFLS